MPSPQIKWYLFILKNFRVFPSSRLFKNSTLAKSSPFFRFLPHGKSTTWGRGPVFAAFSPGMRDKKHNTPQKITSLLGLALPALLLMAPLPARAEYSVDQTTSQAATAELNHLASDKSLQNSTVYAMQALMDLAATNIPSAVSNGYSAYGRYRNSETLDRLTEANIQSGISMASIGADSSVAKKEIVTSTTFRRLDPSFLRQGEAGRVAAEFERQTGMSRDEFLRQMSTISEQKIKSSDPMLFDKALSRLEGFVNKIPNQKFRNSLEKNIAMVPNTMRRGLVAQAVGKFAGMFASATGGSAVTDPGAGKQQTAAASRAPASGNAQAGDGKTGGEKEVAALDAAAQAAAAPGPVVASRDEKNALDNVVQAAIESSASLEGQSNEFTIFQQVTRRYRVLTPGLTHHLN